MPILRYYCPQNLSEGCVVTLAGSELHHLSTVMRGDVGDIVELVNGNGVLAKAEVVELSKHKTVLRIQSSEHTQKRQQKIIIAQALAKMNKLDFIIEKGTELGVDTIQLFPGQLSIKTDFSVQQIEKASLQVISAMKQCGRLFLPSIETISPIKAWKPSQDLIIFGDTNPEAPLLSQVLDNSSFNSVTIVIGPESGLSIDEEAHLKKIGVKGVKLHQNILRAETAALLAIGLINNHFLVHPVCKTY